MISKSDVLKKLDQIDDLPTLPVIAMEVNKMLQDYDTSINELSKTIEKDQAMVPKILKLVNSAFFGFRSKVSDINRAIIVLGFNTVRNAIVSISIINAFSKKEIPEDFDIAEFWKHSIGVAVTSKHLAKMTGMNRAEDYFTGGLLHDIGKVVLVQYFRDLFKKVWISTHENNLSFYEAEKKEIPIAHPRIGGYLAKKWQLPVGLVDTIRFHHGPAETANDYELLMIVHAANIIVNNVTAVSREPIDILMSNSDIKELMEPQLDTLEEWYPEVSKEIESACEFFLNEI
ncbi:MAG: HDOD domain-containing protein [Desulfatiglans sp.]|jgi:putative nucleotidyltransferase with HDIG domain|nr:HDOD domain-containing protein [Desulfatiglans sp.]